jgi:hypothetical protein
MVTVWGMLERRNRVAINLPGTCPTVRITAMTCRPVIMTIQEILLAPIRVVPTAPHVIITLLQVVMMGHVPRLQVVILVQERRMELERLWMVIRMMMAFAMVRTIVPI